MKEIIRPNEDGTFPTPLTDLLDPSGKPYLVQEMKTGRFFILYWKAHFNESRRSKNAVVRYSWTGSDWFDQPECRREGFRKSANYPASDPIRIWELPDVKYASPVNYTGHNHKMAD